MPIVNQQYTWDMTEPGRDDETTDEAGDAADMNSSEGPAWVRGAAVRWFGVVVFLLMGVVALLVFIATILAIYDRARDDSPGSSPAGLEQSAVVETASHTAVRASSVTW